MKIRLFKAPCVDDEGVDREKVCAAVIGYDSDVLSLADLDALTSALDKGERLLVFEDDIDLAWL